MRYVAESLPYLGQTLRKIVPWNLPLLAMLVHLTVAGGVLRWLTSVEKAKTPQEGRASETTSATSRVDDAGGVGKTRGTDKSVALLSGDLV